MGTLKALDEVRAAATGTLFARSAASLRRDFDAVSAAPVLPWTTSPVEGRVSHQDAEARDAWPGLIGSGSAPPAPEIGCPPASNIKETLIAGRAPFGRKEPCSPEAAGTTPSLPGVADAAAVGIMAGPPPAAAPARMRRVGRGCSVPGPVVVPRRFGRQVRRSAALPARA